MDKITDSFTTRNYSLYCKWKFHSFLLVNDNKNEQRRKISNLIWCQIQNRKNNQDIQEEEHFLEKYFLLSENLFISVNSSSLIHPCDKLSFVDFYHGFSCFDSSIRCSESETYIYYVILEKYPRLIKQKEKEFIPVDWMKW